MTAVPEAIDILSPSFAADPYAAYRIMREEAPLIWHEAMGSWIVSRYEDVSRAFRSGDFTTENYARQIEPVHGRTILSMSGREHSVRRALVAPAFRGRELRETFLPLIEDNARALIDGFRRDGADGHDPAEHGVFTRGPGEVRVVFGV